MDPAPPQPGLPELAGRGVKVSSCQTAEFASRWCYLRSTARQAGTSQVCALSVFLERKESVDMLGNGWGSAESHGLLLLKHARHMCPLICPALH